MLECGVQTILALRVGTQPAFLCSLEFISFDLIYIMAGWLPDPYTTVAALSVA